MIKNSSRHTKTMNIKEFKFKNCDNFLDDLKRLHLILDLKNPMWILKAYKCTFEFLKRKEKVEFFFKKRNIILILAANHYRNRVKSVGQKPTSLL
jgi:hypothetical protein